MINMRTKERVKASPVLRYWTRDRSMMISQANNVSERGISFNTGKAYRKDTPVYIQLRTPFGLDETITFKARVKHQAVNPDTALYETGAEIVDYHEKDSQRMQGYIEFMKSLTQ